MINSETVWENISKNWKRITNIYERLFKIPELTINYVAIYDIIVFVASGRSNNYIFKALNLDVDYIKSVCREFLDFDGWEESLDVNPLLVYNYCSEHAEFVNAFLTLSPFEKLDNIERAFKVCIRLKEIERNIDDNYY